MQGRASKRKRTVTINQAAAESATECKPSFRKSALGQLKCKDKSANKKFDMRAWVMSAQSAMEVQRNGPEYRPEHPETKADQQS